MILVSKRINKISEYFFSEKMKEINNFNKYGRKIINLGIGKPDLPPPIEVIKKMKLAADLKHANSYQSYIGIISLRKAISNWYQKIYNVFINPDDEILPLIGSKEGIMQISMCYLNYGDKVLIPNPGYPVYSSISKLLGAKIIYYDLYEKDNWLPNIKNLEKKIKKNKIKIIWVNYPHMPTGSIIEIEKLSELVNFAIKYNILIVYDNPYSLLISNKHSVISIFNVENAKKIAIELNSLSKTYNMSGWRIGMIIGQNNFIKNILKINSQIHSGMYYPIQIGAIEAMKHNCVWFKTLIKEYYERRKIIWKICDVLKFSYKKDNNGIFIWAKLNDKNFDDLYWSQYLLKKYQIFVTPGRVFGNNGKGYVRLSICCSKNILTQAAERIIS